MDKQADIDPITNRTNAIFEAVRSKNNLLVEKAIAEGRVDVNLKQPGGWSLLHHACMFSNKEIAEFLIKNGADVNSATVEGSTPLHVIGHGCTLSNDADTQADVEIAKLLIEKGANINARSKRALEWTPLHCAVGHNQIEIAEVFIRNGADIHAKDTDGETAVDLAKPRYMPKKTLHALLKIIEKYSMVAKPSLKEMKTAFPQNSGSIIKEKPCQHNLTKVKP